MVIKKTKVVDKWKLKKWYTVLAPSLFEQKQLPEIVASEDQTLINRIIKVSLMDLVPSSSSTSMYTAVFFRINNVAGTNASTKLIGHEVSPAYIKTFARRGKILLHMTVDTKTKDEEDLRVKMVVVTTGKISENTRRNLRNAAIEEVQRTGPSFTYDELMQEILYGRLASKLFHKLKQITSLKRFEIRKTEKKEIFA